MRKFSFSPKLHPKVVWWLLAYTGLAVVVAFFVPLPFDLGRDFFAVYAASRMWLEGVPFYEPTAQLNWKIAAFGPAIQQDFSLSAPYFYPPWYLLALAFVGYLPMEVGAKLFLFINLGLLIFTIVLLLPADSALNLTTLRLVSINLIGAVLFFPTIVVMFTGQYTLPVVFGMALFIYAAQRHSDWGMAAGLALITFKPHIGLPVLVVLGLWLLYQRYWGALTRSLLIALVFVASGFLVDSNWLNHYWLSLTNALSRRSVLVCEVCFSFSLEVVALVTGRPALNVATPLAITSAGLWLVVAAAQHKRRPLSAEQAVFHAVFVTLLANPYMVTYDFVVMLPIIIWLACRGEKWAYALYMAPLLVLLVWGREPGGLVMILVLFVGALLLLARHNSAAAFLGSSAVD